MRSSRSSSDGGEGGARGRGALIAWVLVAAWAGFIFFMSARTASEFQHDAGILALLKEAIEGALAHMAGQSVDIMPIAHFCEYFLFALLLANAMRHHARIPLNLALAWVIAALYAITDELHQAFVPGRDCDAADWVTDVAGAAIALCLWWVFHQLRNRNSSNGAHTDGSQV